MQYNLTLQDLEIEAHIGWTEEERARAQILKISIDINFFKQPQASSNDNLENTICYDNLSKIIANYSKNTKHKLLEKYGYDLYQELKKTINKSGKFSLKICKQPPLEFVSGPACFIISE